MLDIKNLSEFNLYVISQFPKEACGYVVDGCFLPCENIALNPCSEFEIHPADQQKYQDIASCLIHSHTERDGNDVDPRRPSKSDMEGQVETGLEWAIVYCDGVSVTTPIGWGNPANRPSVFDEQEFVFNAQDCLSLAADYAYQTYGVRLPEHPRDWYWLQNNEDLIERNYKSWGFRKVPLNKARAGDWVLFKIGSKQVNHIGVFLGDNQLLHHLVNRLSGVDELGRWSKFIHCVIRYKGIKE